MTGRPVRRGVEPPEWTTSVVIALARQCVAAVLERAKARPLPKRRSDRGERRWLVSVVKACGVKLSVVDGLACGGCYRIAQREIWIDERVLRNPTGDVAFTVGHELGHWAWFEILGLPGFETSPVEHGRCAAEWLPNVFAALLLRRGPRDAEWWPEVELRELADVARSAA